MSEERALRAPSQEPMKIGSVDVEEFSRNLARLIEEGGRALAAYLKPREEGRHSNVLAEEVGEVVKTLGQVAEYWLEDPQRTLEVQARLGKAYLDLWASAAKRLTGEEGPPIVMPEAADKRFADPEWSSNQFYDFLKQAYLLSTRWAKQLVTDAADLDPHTRQKAEFYVRQITNAVSPSNFVLTNPELLRETLLSNADNLVRGMRMLAEDIESGGGDLKIRQSDASMFAVGRNLATTPGKVIFQNELMQLIQYAPSTPMVLKRPLLIVPPWINKFYVLDLTPEKSFIKWCVDQGLTVFCISWVNPDAHLAKKSFEDYIHEGPLAALDAIKEATGEDKVHAIGYCVGGTLLAITLALMAARHDERIVSATLFASQVDFPCRRSESFRRRGADRGDRAQDGRARLPRRQDDGHRLQHVALERSDLALCDQQLPQGQGAVSVRSVVLELRRHAHAGRQSLVLHAQLLPRQQARQGADAHRRRADGSEVGQAADLQSGDPRRPHRAGEIGGARLQILRRPGAFRARRLRPHRRRGQSAGQEQIPVLDRPAAAQRRRRRLARQGQGISRLVVAGLAGLADPPRPDRSPSARARRGRAQGDRGRAGELRARARLKTIGARPAITETARPVRAPSSRESRA